MTISKSSSPPKAPPNGPKTPSFGHSDLFFADPERDNPLFADPEHDDLLSADLRSAAFLDVLAYLSSDDDLDDHNEWPPYELPLFSQEEKLLPPATSDASKASSPIHAQKTPPPQSAIHLETPPVSPHEGKASKQLIEEALEAILRKQFHDAYQLFLLALQLEPNNTFIQANLKRFQQMDIKNSSQPSTPTLHPKNR